MSYKDRYGVTKIGINMYSRSEMRVSWDFEDDENDISQRKPVLLYIPDLDQPDHEHIELTIEGARDLRDWLIGFCNEQD